ncbi:MAG: DegV family protein [Anaerolineales bacterium]|jgi:DegV family protein with EDD domain
MDNHKIAIVTDSSANIPESATKGLPIHVIPVWLIWGEERFRDGVDIDSPTVYKRLEEESTMPTTSQPSIGEFVEFFKGLLGKYDSVVAVLVSSGLSGTVASARGALEELPGKLVRVVDTMAGSMAHGFCVLEAARAAVAGKSLDEVVAAAKNLIPKVNLLFAVDTLEYLRKSGRISGAKAILGSALSIKPLLQFKDGTIKPHSQVRTKRKALKMLLDAAEELLGGKKIKEAAVIDINVEQEGDEFAEVVKSRFGLKDLLRCNVSPVVGVLVGPGGLGLAFYPEE